MEESPPSLAGLNRVPRESFPAQWTFHRVWALISLGRLEEAQHMVGAALQKNPEDQAGALHAARAMLRAKAGNLKVAEADIADAIRVGKDFIHFHHTAIVGFPNCTRFEHDVHLEGHRATPRFGTYLSKLRQEWEHIPGELE